MLKNPTIRTIAAIAVAIQAPGWGTSLFGITGNAAQAFGGFAAGLIQGRGDLKVAISGAFSGAAFGMIHNMPLGDFRPLAHGFAGGLGNVIAGGDFKSGFLAGGFAGVAGNSSFVKGLEKQYQLAARMIVGGHGILSWWW